MGARVIRKKPCPRCKSTDVVPACNYGREVKPRRWWCMKCGWLEEPGRSQLQDRGGLR